MMKFLTSIPSIYLLRRWTHKPTQWCNYHFSMRRTTESDKILHSVQHFMVNYILTVAFRYLLWYSWWFMLESHKTWKDALYSHPAKLVWGDELRVNCVKDNGISNIQSYILVKHWQLQVIHEKYDYKLNIYYLLFSKNSDVEGTLLTRQEYAAGTVFICIFYKYLER